MSSGIPPPRVTLAFTADTVTMLNDGVESGIDRLSGLAGIRHRVEPLGATLVAERDGNLFRVTLRLPEQAMSTDPSPISVVVVDDESLVASSCPPCWTCRTISTWSPPSARGGTAGLGGKEPGLWSDGGCRGHGPAAWRDRRVETAGRLPDRARGAHRHQSWASPALKRALAHGVLGFLPKSVLCRGVRHRGAHRPCRTPPPRPGARRCGDQCRESPSDRPGDRGARVAGQGSVEQIAQTVHLAAGTTRNYLSSAMTKTGASTASGVAHRT